MAASPLFKSLWVLLTVHNNDSPHHNAAVCLKIDTIL